MAELRALVPELSAAAAHAAAAAAGGGTREPQATTSDHLAPATARTAFLCYLASDSPAANLAAGASGVPKALASDLCAALTALAAFPGAWQVVTGARRALKAWG